MQAEFKPFIGAKGPPPDAIDDSQARYRKGHLILLDANDGTFLEYAFDRLPPTLKATSATDVGTEVWVKTTRILVGKYDNGGDAKRVNVDVIVYDVARHAVVAREHIEGDDPPSTIKVRRGVDSGWEGWPTEKFAKFLESLPAR